MLLTSLRWPSAYLGLLTFGFGLVAMATSRVLAYRHLLCLRVLLGICQAGVFPASIFLCTRWYAPRQLALRISCFYLSSNVATMLAGPLAAAVSRLDGRGGIRGWAWIYIMVGGVAMFVGVLDALFLPANPEVAGWLTEEERRLIEDNTGSKADDDGEDMCSPLPLSGEEEREDEKAKNRRQGGFTAKGMKAVFAQWRVWAQCLLYMTVYIIALGTKLSAPSMLRDAGYPVDRAQVLSAIPSLTSGITAIAGALLSDKLMVRGPFIFAPAAGLAACFLTLLVTSLAGKRQLRPETLPVAFALIGLYFGPMGPACSSWVPNNLGTSSKRAVGVALAVSFSGVGGLFASYVMMVAPQGVERYRWSFGWCFALSVATVFGGLVV